MLQWMGGSRRKVTTSRKSTQQRQKQYFEQRRRQQHHQGQTFGLESYTDGVNISEQPNKEHRSLDILSLLNLSKIAQEHKPACSNGREDAEVNASRVKFDITRDLPKVPTKMVALPYYVEFNKARGIVWVNELIVYADTGVDSGFEVEIPSPKKVALCAPDDHSKSLNEANPNPKPDNCTTEFSVLDFVGDDALNDHVEGSPVHESHVAFSVEGLGKMGMETPVHSPNQPGRTFVYDCSSPLNAARGPKSSNGHKHLDDFEMEMDAMMQDINMPLHSSGLKFSNDSMDSFRNSMRKISTYDGYSDSLDSNYGCRRIFDYVENYRKDTRDGGPCFPDDNSFNDWEHDLSWNNWRSPMNCGSVDNLGHGKYKISDFPPEGPFSPIRSAADIKDKFDVLEVPSYSKHRTPENDHDFMNFSGVRHHTVGRKFDFGAVSGPPDWSCLVTESERDRLSEESCSSSAVRVNAMDSSLSKSTRNMSKRRHDHAYDGREYNANTCTGRTRDKNRHVVQPENIAQGSGKCTKMSDSSKLKPSCYLSSPFQEKLTPTTNWVTDERYRSVDRNSSCSSFHEKSETNYHSAGSKLFFGDPFSASPVPELHLDPRSPSKQYEPIANSPSGSFISQNFEFPDSPITPTIRFGPTKPGLRYSHGKMPSPNSSEQESVSKDEKIKAESAPREKSKLVGENITVNDRFFTENNDGRSSSISKNTNSGCTEAKDAAPGLGASIRSTYFPDHAEKSFSSLKTPDRSDGLMDEKEDHHGYQIPLPCQNRNKEIEDAEPLERMKESKQQSDFMDSSCRVMMLQSYVQFLCVQKVLNEAGANKI